MSEQSQEESRPIEGYVAKFDQVDRDGTQISSSAFVDMSNYVSPLYVSGVDHKGHYWAVMEPIFDSVGKLLGYSLVSLNHRAHNGDNN